MIQKSDNLNVMKNWDRVVIYIEPTEKRQIKSKLILKGKTLSDFVREKIREELAK